MMSRTLEDLKRFYNSYGGYIDMKQNEIGTRRMYENGSRENDKRRYKTQQTEN